LNTGNYYLTFDEFILKSAVYTPPPFRDCVFRALPVSERSRTDQNCSIEGEEIRRHFIFYRKKEKLYLFTLSFTRKGEESAQIILESLRLLK